MKLRGKLLTMFVGFALLASGGMSVAGYWLLRERSLAHARVAFRAAREQLDRSVKLRYAVFEAMAALPHVMTLMRGVETVDDSDFGLGSAGSDAQRLADLHQNILDASWRWTPIAREGAFAIADYKGRVVYASAARKLLGNDLMGLPAVAAAYNPKNQWTGAMTVRGNDPVLAATGILGELQDDVWVVLAHVEAPREQPRAAFVQLLSPHKLLGEVALGDQGMALTLVAQDGTVTASLVPDAVVREALAARDDAREISAAGATWLVQSAPLPGLDGGPPVATLVIARNLDVGLALFLTGARLMLLIGLLLVNVALAAALVLSRRLSRPVVELEAAARRVAAGDLTATVTTVANPSDEVGRLKLAFNQMTEGLRERERIKATFKKYLAPPVVEYLLAHPEAQRPGGERKRVSVMFSDLANFTALAESLGPEALVRVLSTYLSAVSERVIARGGIVDKFVGDAMMAFFGAPVPLADHPVRACQAALDHLATLDALSVNWKEGRWPELAVRIGVNTGDVLVGNLGSDNFQDFTVMGDAVNLASRLVNANKDYRTRILATEAVWRDARDAFAWREVDLVRLVGRTQVERIFELVGEAGTWDAHPAKRGCCERYARGLAAMWARDFAGAAAAFQEALAVLPDDGPSAVMLARVEAFRTTPPPEDWDGVYQKLTK